MILLRCASILLLSLLSAVAGAGAGRYAHDGVFVGVLHNRLPGVKMPLPAQLQRQTSRLTLKRDGKSLLVHTELSSGGPSTVMRAVGAIELEGAGQGPGTRMLTVRFLGADYLKTAQTLVDALALHLGGLQIKLIGGESVQTFTFGRDGVLSLEGRHVIERAPFAGLAGLVTNRLVPPRITSESSGTLRRVVE